jgi:hypothetical protein
MEGMKKTTEYVSHNTMYSDQIRIDNTVIKIKDILFCLKLPLFRISELNHDCFWIIQNWVYRARNPVETSDRENNNKNKF